MRHKLLTFYLCSAMCFFSIAQNAPNFSATDINGNNWNLYDLLDQGKTVILDFSTTWCSPCWGFHHEQVLSNLHNAFGPEGSDQLVVLFIESDPTTTMADLEGNTGQTQGDWITGTPFPIIDNASIAEDYNVFGFPTIYTICPDKSMQQTNRQSFDQYINTLIGLCDNSIGMNTDVIATPLIGDLTYQLGCGSASPQVDIMNIGSVNVTSASLSLYKNNNLIQSKNWTGNISPESRASVYFDALDVSEGDIIKMEITSVNNGNDDNPGNNAMTFTIEEITATTISSEVLTFEFHTDVAGYESSFVFEDVTGNTIVEDGPFSQDNHLYTYNITLPSSGCYKLGIYDSFGDGLYPGDAYYALKSGNTVLAESEEFEYMVEYLFNFDIQQTTSIEKKDAFFNLFPNPASELLTINSKEAGELFIIDMNGRILMHQFITEELSTVNISSLVSGSYFVQFRTNLTTYNHHLTIQ